MKHALLLLMLTCMLCGCSHGPTTTSPSTTKPSIGSQVTWRGVAENHKVGAFLSGPDIYVDVPGTHWPGDITGKTVEVQGTVAERHDLPVFIADPDDKEPVAGISVPPGTNLHEASRRVILERVTWKVVGAGW